MDLGLGLGMIGANLAGGLIGMFSSQDDRDSARAAMDKAANLIAQVGAPPDLSMQIIYDQFQQAGLLTPQVENVINTAASQVSQVKERPELLNAQMGALDMLKQRATTGLTAQDIANLNQIRQQTMQDAEAKRQQILSNFQSRGMGGSTNELASQLIASQQAANRQSEEGDRVGAQASQNALAALAQYGGLAGQVRGQDSQINMAKAQAADEFQRFNVANQLAVQQQNVQNQNQSNLYNLQNKQNIANTNTQMNNAEKLRQVEAQRQQWLDKMMQAQSEANAMVGQAGFLNNQANQTSNMWTNIGSGLGSGLGAIGMFGNQPTAQPTTTPQSTAQPSQYNYTPNPQLMSQYNQLFGASNQAGTGK